MDSSSWLRALLFTSLAGCPSGPLNKSNCTDDADCDNGWTCADIGARVEARDPLMQCIQSECTVDDDCDSTCNRIAWGDGCSIRALDQCATQDDSCSSDADCEEGQACIPEDRLSGPLACLDPVNCAIGRPLSTPTQTAATATLRRRSDWGAAQRPPQSAPDVVIEHWRRVAALEHASVGSFARFTLELMALGAPPELLEQAQQAGCDEVRHAVAVFGWIGTLTGDPVGPGSLEVAEIDIASDPADVFGRLVVEGCVGEAVGASLVREDANAAVDPGLRLLLLGIADDEARHAELAWKTAAWMCRRWPWLRRGLAERASRAVQALAALERPEDCEEHGVIGTLAARQLVADVGTTVIVPLCRALERGQGATGSTGRTEATRTITT